MPAAVFENAVSAVETWLDGAGAAFATRAPALSASKRSNAWALKNVHPVLKGSAVELVLPMDFPISSARINVDKSLCLVLPHVEESGKICLGVDFSPVDFENPIGAVERTFKELQYFLTRCEDNAWIHTEFNRERVAYWTRFCDKQRKRSAPHPAVREAHVHLEAFTGHANGRVAIYNEGKLAVVCVGETEPHRIAGLHGIATGTMVRGRALFVNLPESEPWTPFEWPITFPALESLIGRVTDHQLSVNSWLAGKQSDKSKQGAPAHPAFVVLVQGSLLFGYQLFPAPLPHVSSRGIEPIKFGRIDPGWSLSRDHQLDVLNSRRTKHVLVLGCGSLGSPIAELLARAGIGKLTLVDFESFEAENCARHVLGMSVLGKSKSIALKKRLMAEIPGVVIEAFIAVANSWVADSCKPGDFDLVIDSTGESSTRIMLSKLRKLNFGDCGIVHTWLEPFGAAAHTVYLNERDTWPDSDPADSAVNIATWPDDARVNLPACGAGFHVYGAADAWQAAGLATERILNVVDRKVTHSLVWSWIRNRAFFDTLAVTAIPKAIVPERGSGTDAVMITRDLRALLSGYD